MAEQRCHNVREVAVVVGAMDHLCEHRLVTA